jgi:hypothetical protein
MDKEEVMKKPSKTAADLRELIMAEVRKTRGCENVQDVAINVTLKTAEHHPSWAFAWVVDGPAPAPLVVDGIARRFQAEFDLV